MSRWKIRGCPRCSGDLFLDMDERERFGHCLQCGYLSYQPDKMESERSAVSAGERVTAAPPAVSSTKNR